MYFKFKDIFEGLLNDINILDTKNKFPDNINIQYGDYSISKFVTNFRLNEKSTIRE